MNLLSSSGLKRTAVAVLNIVLEIVRQVPSLQLYVPILESIIGSLGGIALLHAAHAESLSQAKIAGVSAALSVLIFLSHFVPALVPWVPLFAQLAAAIGGVGVATAINGGVLNGKTLRSGNNGGLPK